MTNSFRKILDTLYSYSLSTRDILKLRDEALKSPDLITAAYFWENIKFHSLVADKVLYFPCLLSYWPNYDIFIIYRYQDLYKESQRKPLCTFTVGSYGYKYKLIPSFETL